MTIGDKRREEGKGREREREGGRTREGERQGWGETKTSPCKMCKERPNLGRNLPLQDETGQKRILTKMTT